MLVEPGDLVALAAALGWAGTTVMARYISRAIPAVWYNAFRIAIASAVMLAAAPWTLGNADLSKVSAGGVGLLIVSGLGGFTRWGTGLFEAVGWVGGGRGAPMGGW